MAMVEYCVSSGVSASMNEKSREVFNSWMQTILKAYPNEGTVNIFFFILINSDYDTIMYAVTIV